MRVLFGVLKKIFMFDYYEHLFGMIFFLLLASFFFCVWFFQSSHNLIHSITLTGWSDVVVVSKYTAVIWIVKYTGMAVLRPIVR